MDLELGQTDFFDRNGYLLLERAFDAAEVAELRREAAELLAFLVNASVANGRTSARLDLRELPDGTRGVRKIQPFVDLVPRFAALARDPRLVRPIAQLQRSEPELMEDKFSFKQRIAGALPGLHIRRGMDDHFHAHADYAYHADHGYPTNIVTCAIVLDDCTPDNGPFHVWPGTHKTFVPHEPLGDSSHIVPAERLEGEGLDVLAPAGSVIFFSDLVVHSSGPNATPDPRRILFFSYCPRGSMPDADTRNGPLRRAEEQFEARYRAMVAAGTYQEVHA